VSDLAAHVTAVLSRSIWPSVIARGASVRVPAADDVKGSLLARSGFGEEQRAVSEVERCKPQFSGHFCASWLPLKSSGNHQMDDQKEIAIKFPDDLLTQTR